MECDTQFRLTQITTKLIIIKNMKFYEIDPTNAEATWLISFQN